MDNIMDNIMNKSMDNIMDDKSFTNLLMKIYFMDRVSRR